MKHRHRDHQGAVFEASVARRPARRVHRPAHRLCSGGGVDIEQGEVVDRLKAYLDRFPDGAVGGGSRSDTTDDDLIDRMIEMIEDRRRDEFSAY